MKVSIILVGIFCSFVICAQEVRSRKGAANSHTGSQENGATNEEPASSDNSSKPVPNPLIKGKAHLSHFLTYGEMIVRLDNGASDAEIKKYATSLGFKPRPGMNGSPFFTAKIPANSTAAQLKNLLGHDGVKDITPNATFDIAADGKRAGSFVVSTISGNETKAIEDVKAAGFKVRRRSENEPKLLVLVPSGATAEQFEKLLQSPNIVSIYVDGKSSAQ